MDPEYTDREMRLMDDRDKALCRAENAEEWKAEASKCLRGLGFYLISQDVKDSLALRKIEELIPGWREIQT